MHTTLHARNKDGRECTVPIQSLTAELVCIKDGTTTECRVKDEDKSKYVIKYKPTTRGNHELHIRIKGKSTKGSPFTVTVRPSLQTLGNPIRAIGNVKGPWGLTTNSKGHIIVVENKANWLKRKQQSYCMLGTRMTESVRNQSKTLLLNWCASKMVPPLNVKSEMRIGANT